MSIESYPKFSIADIYKVKCVDVYDGDTITVVFNPFPKDNLSKIWSFKIRAYGYDSPEIRPRKTIKNRDEHIKNAKISRDYLYNLLFGNEIIIDTMGFDNFGRILAVIYISKKNYKLPNIKKIRKNKKKYINKMINVNELMLQLGFGDRYFV